jgi:hypothetical protein
MLNAEIAYELGPTYAPTFCPHAGPGGGGVCVLP